MFSEGVNVSWIGYMSGNLELDTELSTDRMATLKLTDDFHKHMLFFGGTYVYLAV